VSVKGKTAMTSERPVENAMIDTRLLDALLVLIELNSKQMEAFRRFMELWPIVDKIDKAVLRLDQLHEALIP
jgi:hypothetical protein